MTLQFVSNSVVASGSAALYGFKVLLTSVGWTVPRSGNGASGGAGDFIAAIADLENANSWMVLRRPDSGAEWLFSMGGTAGKEQWDILYSKGALFIGGAAAVRATAADEQFIQTDATFTFIGAATWNHVADDAAPYGWVSYGWSGANFGGMIIYEPVTQGYADDPDPYLCGHGIAYDRWRVTETGDTATSLTAKGWSGATWGAIPGSQIFSTSGPVSFPNGCGVNPYSGSGEDATIPIPFARSTGVAGTSSWKGFSTLTRWVGTTRAFKSTLTSGTRSYVVCGSNDDICIPWENGVVPA